MDKAKLNEAADQELVLLWRELEQVIHNSVGDHWPPAADHVLDRIKALTAAVGPAPWGQVPLVLVEAGLYQEVNLGLGLAAGPARWEVAEARLRSDRARMA